MTRLIAVFEASPGIGKSTLTRRLAANSLPEARIDTFNEEDILTRPEFATVAAQYRATGVVELDALLDASERFVGTALTYDVVFTDTLFPFVPSLLAWGHDDATIRSFLTRLRAILQPLEPVVVYLDGDPAEALPRAAGRSGEAWLTKFLTKVSTYETDSPVVGMAATVEYLRHERNMTLASMIDAGYVVVVLHEAHTRPVDDLVDEARLSLARLTRSESLFPR